MYSIKYKVKSTYPYDGQEDRSQDLIHWTSLSLLPVLGEENHLNQLFNQFSISDPKAVALTRVSIVTYSSSSRASSNFKGFAEAFPQDASASIRAKLGRLGVAADDDVGDAGAGGADVGTKGISS